MSKDIGEHFTLTAMTRSAKAQAAGVSNVPNATELEHIKELVTKILDPLRNSLNKPIIVNSGFRNAKTNKLAGGVYNSAHLSGYAADIVCPTYGNPTQFAKYIHKWLVANNIAFDQLINEYGSWVHIGIRDGSGRQRREVFSMHRGKPSTPGV